MITDGAANFHDAFKKVFFTINSPRTRHISHIRLQGDHNSNKMERLDGEIRDREKVMNNEQTLRFYQDIKSIIIIIDRMIENATMKAD